jgi:hypothetical protein
MASLSTPFRAAHSARDVRTGSARRRSVGHRGELRDERPTPTKTASAALPAGAPMHLMRARLTVDHEMTACGGSRHGRHPSRPAGAAAPARDLIASPKRGFGRAIEEAMGRTSGCTQCATSSGPGEHAYQTISAYREQFMPELGAPKAADGERPFSTSACRGTRRPGGRAIRRATARTASGRGASSRAWPWRSICRGAEHAKREGGVQFGHLVRSSSRRAGTSCTPPTAS